MNYPTKEITVGPKTSIRDTIKAIDQGGVAMALVADGEERLLGVVTDCDVRRGLLKNISMDEPVEKIMNRMPTTAPLTATRSHLIEAMKQKCVNQLPVVDDRSRVIRLELLSHLLKEPEGGRWAVIMAGGLGIRLRPLTDHLPKPLLKVGDKPIMRLIVERLAENGFRDIMVAINYKGEMIEDYFGDGSRFGVRIQYLREEERRGTVGALNMVKDVLHHPFIVVNGDVMTHLNFESLIAFHTRFRYDMTMAVRRHEIRVPYGVVKMVGSEITHIEEKPKLDFFVNAGIYAMNPEVLRFMEGEGYLDMPALANRVIEGNGRIGSFPILEHWMDIGQMQEYESAQVCITNHESAEARFLP